MKGRTMSFSRIMLFLLAFLFLATATGTIIATADDAKKKVELRPEMSLKVGDEVYACNCGAACKCDTLSVNAGKCTCGKDMVKAKALTVGKGEAKLLVSGEERTFKSVGKYACACGLQCACNTISQNPGNCTCGKEMQPVKPS